MRKAELGLAERLQAWDGGKSTELESVFLERSAADDFVDQLIGLLDDEAMQVAVTWLLKHYLEQQRRLEARHTKKLLNKLIQLKAWQARIHLLQSLEYLDLNLGEASILERFVRNGLADQNKFVRAWSYHGFALLTLIKPELEKDLKTFITLAQRDEPASVQARLRQTLKRYPQFKP